MFSSPLLLLLRLQGKAMLRRSVRGIKTFKGAFLFLVGVLVLALWIGPTLIFTPHGKTDPAQVRLFSPFIILGLFLLMLLTGSDERGIVFSPSEIDFLFPGPFTRRQLLGYKIIKGLAACLFSGLFMSLAAIRHAASFPACLAGVAMAIFFLQLSGIVLILAYQSVGKRAYTRFRRFALSFLLLGLALWIGLSLRNLRGGVLDLIPLLVHSRWAQIALTPLAVFGNILTAPNLTSLALWFAAAAGINLLLILAIFALDADYLETSLIVGQKRLAMTQRARQGAGLATMGVSKPRFTIPALPFLGGAGPIAWRQLVTATRCVKGAIFLVIIAAFAGGPMLLSHHRGFFSPSAVIGFVCWFTFFFVGMVRFDFRSDLPYLEQLKTLPISPLAVAAGQIAMPTFILCACHWIFLAFACIINPSSWPILLPAFLTAPFFNILLIGAQNAFFLFYPTRNPGAGMADVQNFGKQFILMLFKFLLILLAFILGGIPAGIVYYFTRSILAAEIVGAMVLMLMAWAALKVVAFAFSRFDLARDMPA